MNWRYYTEGGSEVSLGTLVKAHHEGKVRLINTYTCNPSVLLADIDWDTRYEDDRNMSDMSWTTVPKTFGEVLNAARVAHFEGSA